MKKYYYNSPVGTLEITYQNEALTSLNVIENTKDANTKTPLTGKIKTQLDEYFSGKRKSFNIEINPQGTKFQKAVWEELLKIPYGETRSYSEIAERVGKHNAQRAVGSACNKNPILVLIPCHRVISKKGNLAGYACGLDIKRELLKIENIK